MPSRPLMKCSCGRVRSITSRTAAPSRMAAPTVRPAPHGPIPWVLAASMPGATSEQAPAASITPAPKPNMLSCTFCGMVRAKRMGSVPSAVAAAAPQPPSRASATCGARTSR
ncbi:hypothetical protein G6F50_017434 [Rhizopus delemar]|uniref:Uncharacterized protein n=1 Tax=Rhizopus delemar TaxID=936053 RepID=A0A9P6XQ16_9FUNG|nr:hypothetical protein G6F50_017434 [Rhizopus delemar]